ncbi:MAG: hypothetical protein IJ456_03670, partial [Bacteroides sp.]|nr:hypothetical protein [Bacteroides sp.]
MKARTHFLLGFYLRMNNRAEAVRELMTASHYAEQTGDKVLLAVIYRFMGRELYYAKVYRQSDSIFHLAEDLAIEQQDTLLWMESLLHPLLTGQAFGLDVSTHQQRLRQCELGMKLAHSYGHREYEGDFARIMAEEYMRWQYRNTGYKEKALHYAKQAYRLGNNRKVHEVLANAYVATGHLDSAAVHFDTVYGKNWRETGTGGIGTFAVYEPSNQEEVAAAEITLQKEWQQAEYEGFLTRYKHLLLGIAIGAVALIALLHLYHRRKYRRQSELLQAQQKKQQLLHGILQENLQKKDEEIARLLKERAQRHADEEAQQALTEELSAANENRRILAKETLEHSPAYNKVQLIMADFRWKEESDHRLTDADWQELADCVDTCYGQMLKRLAYQYKLTDREVSICCLLKLDIPVVHIAHLIGYTRPVVYKTERAILEKMGFPYEKGALRKLLKKY